MFLPPPSSASSLLTHKLCLPYFPTTVCSPTYNYELGIEYGPSASFGMNPQSCSGGSNCYPASSFCVWTISLDSSKTYEFTVQRAATALPSTLELDVTMNGGTQ